MLREEKVIIGMCLVILGLFLVQIYLENMSVTQGNSLEIVTQKIQAVRRENEELQVRILYLSSFTYISKEASKEGFRKTDAVISFN